MARFVHLEIERTDHTAAAGGVLAAAVYLRVRGVTVLDWRLTGLNGSAIALARAAAGDHLATPGNEWPLFFAAQSLTDRERAADCSVRHDGTRVTLSDFRGCTVGSEARFTVPWSAFAGAVLRVGDFVVRRTAASAWREELRERLRPIRARRRALTRAERP
jgi:hypothetical protein